MHFLLRALRDGITTNINYDNSHYIDSDLIIQHINKMGHSYGQHKMF